MVDRLSFASWKDMNRKNDKTPKYAKTIGAFLPKFHSEKNISLDFLFQIVG